MFLLYGEVIFEFQQVYLKKLVTSPRAEHNIDILKIIIGGPNDTALTFFTLPVWV